MKSLHVGLPGRMEVQKMLQSIDANTSATFSLLWPCGPTRVMASSFLRFVDYTQRRTTGGRTLLDE